MEQEVEDICTGEEELSSRADTSCTTHFLCRGKWMILGKAGRESKKLYTWCYVSKIKQAVVIHVHMNDRGLIYFFNCESIKKQQIM